LAVFFITDAVLAEVIGGKLFTLGPFTMSSNAWSSGNRFGSSPAVSRLSPPAN
jgi:hypothetical protein